MLPINNWKKLMKRTGMIFVLFLGLQACAPENLAEQDIRKNSAMEDGPGWSSADITKPPFAHANLEDAYTADGFTLLTEESENPIFLLRTGWEDGWSFYVESIGKWTQVGDLNELFSAKFEYGDFTEDGIGDLLLHASREDNLFDVLLPEMPRLMIWDGQVFSKVSIACSSTLQSFYSSRMTSFLMLFNAEGLPQDALAFQKEIVETEQHRLKSKCSN